MRSLLSSIFIAAVLVGCSQGDEEKITSSFSVVCNQPHEDVGGYKLGCPFVDKKNFKLEVEDKKTNSALYLKQIEGFFDFVKIGVINNNIEMVEFGANEDSIFSQKDVDDLVFNLKKRWGSPQEEKDDYSFIWSFDNGVVGNIDLFAAEFSGKNNTTLRYQSIKLVDIEKEFQESAKTERRKELSTY